MDHPRVQLSILFHDFMKTQGLLDAAPRFAVATSGGADSLCLALVVYDWAQEQGAEVVALTVDHGLRDGSRHEAEKVHQWLSEQGIEHHILSWDGPKPTSRIQERAREARYTLLEAACRHHGCQALLLGHHHDDQIETFFMRLSAGSGPDGLAGMPAVRHQKELLILRPFLEVPSDKLKAYLKEQGQKWIDDPSNDDHAFLRIRLRKVLEEEGLSRERLFDVMAKFKEDRAYFQGQVEQWIGENVRGQFPLYCHAVGITDLPSALGKRVLRKLLRDIHGKPFPPRSEVLGRLWAKVCAPDFTATTCDGCYLMARRGGLHIQREFSAITDVLQAEDLPALWDNRIPFAKKDLKPGQVVKALGSDHVPELKGEFQTEIPSLVWPTLPAIWEGEKFVRLPKV